MILKYSISLGREDVSLSSESDKARGFGRPGFMEWIDRQAPPDWGLLPLTHITRGVIAEDIIRHSKLEPRECPVFERPLAYFFYGRPAYRVGANGVVKTESLCPFCFIFKPELIDLADALFAFDTGAFIAQMYSKTVSHEMTVADFRLKGPDSANRLISAVFGTLPAYFEGLIGTVTAARSFFHANAYLDLIRSPNSDQPDDRLCSIEVIVNKAITLSDWLLALALPHTLLTGPDEASWLQKLRKTPAQILGYQYLPGRHPEHYHSKMVDVVRSFYEVRKYL